jgi:HD-GYP domain-containing protein (c-di-GMP phosphodiesterase class II)
MDAAIAGRAEHSDVSSPADLGSVPFPERLETAMTALNRALTSLDFYPSEHPLVAQSLEHAHARLSALLDEVPEITLKLIEGHMVYGEHRLFAGAPPPGLIGGLLRRDVQGITFARGLRLAEVAELARIARMQPSELEAHGGVKAEMLRRGIAHVRLEHLVITGTQAGGGYAAASAGDVYLRALDVVHGAMASALNGRVVDVASTRDVVRELVDRVLEDRPVVVSLTCLKGHDDYTFAHSLHICLLSLALGDSMGLDQSQLCDLGTCALLHDVGKVLVPLKVLRKPGKLDGSEWEAICRHPVDGARILSEYEELPPLAPVVAFEHHMRYDLGGYPKARGHKEMSPFSMVVSIADVYDALTTQRPYRQPMRPEQAVETMIQEGEGQFEPRLVRWFADMLGAYPPGSFVQLTSGESGVVCCANPNDASRPLVRVLFDANGRRLDPPVDVDLSEVDPAYRGYRHTISDCIDPASVGVAPMDVVGEWARDQSKTDRVSE